MSANVPSLRYVGIFAPILCLFAFCAKIADPLPPLVRIPDPVEVQLVQQALDRIEFLVPAPLDGIREVEIYRECGRDLSADFEGTLQARIELAQAARQAQSAFLIFEDPEPSFSEPCRYQLQVRNEQGRRSLPSPTGQTVVTSPPKAPTNIELEVQEQQIVVSWDPPSSNMDGSEPATVVGYLVNSVHVVSGTQFVDSTVVFGKAVGYSVQTVGNLDRPAVLSRPSKRLEVVPVDRFAPAAPRNLTAVPLDSKVQLLWDAVADTELAGYYVYRGAEEGRLEKSSPLVTFNRYVDPQPRIGSLTYYAVTAVDNYDNESILSEFATVTVDP